MTGRRDDDDAGLTAFFDAARTMSPEPDAALLARILDDAETAQISARPARLRRNRPDWSAIWRTFGGWPSMAGLTAATAAGIWIGVAAPEMLGGPMQLVLGGGTDMVIDAEPVTAFLMPEEAM